MSYPAGPWVRVHHWYWNEESQWENVLWYEALGSPVSNFDIQAFAAGLYTNWHTEIEACLSDAVTYSGLTAYYNNGLYTATGEKLGVTQGGAGVNMLPTESSVIIRLQSNTAGPAGRGRMFFSGIAEDDTAGSRLTSGAITRFTALRDKLLTYPTTEGLHGAPLLYSRKTNALLPLAYMQVDQVLGHRSSRRPRR